MFKYKIVIWKTGKLEHDEEFTMFGFDTAPEAWEAFYDNIDRIKQAFGPSYDGAVYLMDKDELDRLGYGRFR